MSSEEIIEKVEQEIEELERGMIEVELKIAKLLELMLKWSRGKKSKKKNVTE